MTTKFQDQETAANDVEEIGDVNVEEGMQAKYVNNAIRELTTQIALWFLDGDTVTAAAETDLSGKESQFVTVSGNSQIDGFGEPENKPIFFLLFTGTGQITHDGTSNILPGGANITRAAGDIAIVRHEGSGNWRCLFYQKATGRAVVEYAQDAVLGAGYNIVVQNNAGSPNSQMDINADELILKTTGGEAYLAKAVDLTVDITAAGANGLDTGSEAANTWYYLWVIYNPTTATLAGLLSLSSTSPTMPSDYTFKALVGAVQNSAASNLRTTRGVNGEFIFTGLTALAGATVGTPGTFEELNLATAVTGGAVPAAAKTVSGLMGSAVNSAFQMSVASTDSGTGAQSYGASSAGSALDSFYSSSHFRLPLPTASKLWWTSLNVASAARVVVNGFTL